MKDLFKVTVKIDNGSQIYAVLNTKLNRYEKS